MFISRLRVSQVRNLQTVQLHPGTINVITGSNGSGKTSVLESIYLLGSGRSFRASRLDPVIGHEAEECTVFGTVKPASGGTLSLGVTRRRDGSFEGRLSGQPIRTAAELAKSLPLQLINSDTFKLLEGGPKIRRQFLDWGVFHVEHGFHSIWLEAQRSIRQRNSLLRRDKLSVDELRSWDRQFCRAAEQLDAYRTRYFDVFYPVFQATLSRLISLDSLGLSYQRGWDKESSLSQLLDSAFERDRQRGFTGSGPHRADIRVRFGVQSAVDVLSRGQQKLVVCAMKVAQGLVYSKVNGQACVFLIDDLPAELDRNHRALLCKLLTEMGCQVFVTCVESAELDDCWDGVPAANQQVFHVEQGAVSRVSL